MTPSTSKSIRNRVAPFLLILLVVILAFMCRSPFSSPEGASISRLRIFSDYIDQIIFGLVSVPLSGQRLVLMLAAVVLLMICVITGALLLSFAKLLPKDFWEQLLFSAAVGLGVMSLLTLGLGLISLLNRWTILAIFCVLVVLAIKRFRSHVETRLALQRALSDMKGSAKGNSPFTIALLILMAFFFLTNLAGAFTPPWEYDVQEYHLGAPAQFFRNGEILFLKDNVYANFPENVEMTYLLSMALTGDTILGAYLGKLVNVFMGVLTALVIRAMGRRLFSPKVGDIAAAIFYCCPSVTMFSTIAYVEMGLTFYSTLGIYAFLLYCEEGRSQQAGTSGWLKLSGIAAGLAMGCKYPSVLFLFIPITIGVAANGLLTYIEQSSTNGRQKRMSHHSSGLLACCFGIIKDVAAFGSIALILFSPWMLKNVVYTRNPVYPLLHSVFGSSNWDAERDARFKQAHAPDEVSFRAIASSLKGFFAGKFTSVLLFAPLPLLILIRGRPKPTLIYLFCYFLLYFCCWFFFTHRIDRFLAPAIPALALICGYALCLPMAPRAKVAAQIAIISLVLSCGLDVGRLGLGLGSFSTMLGVEKKKFFDNFTDFSPGYRAMRYLNEELPGGSKVLFVGEVRGFYCQRDFVANIVFDTNVLAEIVGASNKPEDVFRQMKNRGITHILINTSELARLQNSYAFDYGGRRHLGILDGFNWQLFDAFLRQYTTRAYTFAGVDARRFNWGEFDKLRSERNLLKETESRFGELDRDSDGKLSQQELDDEERFRKIEKDGNGFITRDELRSPACLALFTLRRGSGGTKNE